MRTIDSVIHQAKTSLITIRVKGTNKKKVQPHNECSDRELPIQYIHKISRNKQSVTSLTNAYKLNSGVQGHERILGIGIFSLRTGLMKRLFCLWPTLVPDAMRTHKLMVAVYPYAHTAFSVTKLSLPNPAKQSRFCPSLQLATWSSSRVKLHRFGQLVPLWDIATTVYIQECALVGANVCSCG